MAAQIIAVCFLNEQICGYEIPIRSEDKAKLIFKQTVDANSASSLAVAADRVYTELANAGVEYQPVIIGLDCFQCLYLDLPETGVTGTKAIELEIQLEEDCPVDAENMAAMHYGENKVVVAIKNRVSPFVDKLVEKGAQIDSVVPTSLLLGHQLISERNPTDSTRLTIRNSDHVESLEIEAKTICNWNFGSLPDCDDDSNTNWLVTDSESPDAETESDSLESASEEFPFDLVFANAIRNLSNNQFDSANAPIFDSLVGRSKQTPLLQVMKLVGISTAFLLASICVTCFWSGLQMNRQISELDTRINEIYREAFPNSKPTRLVERALKSKRDQAVQQNQLLMSSKSSGKISEGLFALMNSVPVDYSIRIRTIKVDPTRLTILGRARQLADLDKFKTRFDELGFQIIQNEQEYGTEFRLSYLLPDEIQFSDLSQLQQGTPASLSFTKTSDQQTP